MKAEQLRQELKHKKQWDNLHAKNDAAAKELEQLQVSIGRGEICRGIGRRRDNLHAKNDSTARSNSYSSS